MFPPSDNAKCTSRRKVGLTLCALVLCCTNAHAGLIAKKDVSYSGMPNPALVDGFETVHLNQQMWWMGQAQKGEYWSDARMARADRRSVAVRVGSKMRGCGAKCQRNEIRTSPNYRINFGQEAWYNFSFRLDGKLPDRNTQRWVTGQWKQQCGGSPFLAQRFDRGVFQITVQDNNCRVVVASSAGLDRPLPFTRYTGARKGSAAKTGRPCRSDIKVEYSANPTLPNPNRNWVDMSYRVRGGRNGTGLIEIWADGRFIARVTGSIGYDYSSGPKQYFKFGIYRAPVPGASTARIDRFRRSDSMSDFRLIDGT